MHHLLRVWLLAMPVLFPLALLRFSLGPVPFSVLEVLVWALFLLWSASVLQREGWRKWLAALLRPFGSLASPMPWLLLVVFASFATWWVVPQEVVFNTGIKEHLFATYETRRILLGILKGWMVPLLLYGHLLSTFVRTREERTEAMAWSVVGACVLAVVALVARYLLGLPDTLDGRLGGIYVSANYLVFLVAPAFVWSLERVIRRFAGQEEGKLWHGQLALVAFPLLGLVLLLARSYASWMVVAILGLVLVLRWVRGKKLLLLGVLALVLGGALLSTETGSEKLRGFFTVDAQSSTSTRLEVYTISLELLRRHWLLGMGPGQYETQYITNAHSILGKTPYEWVMLHPHNLFLSLWLSVGLAGLVGFLGWVGTALWGAWRDRSLTLVLPLVYLLLHGLVDTPFWKLDSMLLFALLVACSASWSQRT